MTVATVQLLALVLIFMSLFFSMPMDGRCLHLEMQQCPSAQIVFSYHFKDLGDVDIDPSKLSRLSSRLSLGPLLNNDGWSISNKGDGGFVVLPSGFQYAPRINDMLINIYSINNNGDLLVALERGPDSIEWMVWPWKNESYGSARKHLHTVNPFKIDFVVAGFNDNRLAVGHRKVDGKNRPFVWTAEVGFQSIGQGQGLQLEGIAKQINSSGAIAGILEEPTDRYPFFYDERGGLQAMRTYRNVLQPRGWIEFSDMLLSSDDHVFGTYWIRHLTVGDRPKKFNPHYAYHWNPQDGKVDQLDLKGMRLADINSQHVLVGELNGQAAICELGRPPVELIALMDQSKVDGWELLEATSINDKRQIMGYGRFNGHIHLFVADPAF